MNHKAPSTHCAILIRSKPNTARGQRVVEETGEEHAKLSRTKNFHELSLCQAGVLFLLENKFNHCISEYQR